MKNKRSTQKNKYTLRSNISDRCKSMMSWDSVNVQFCDIFEVFGVRGEIPDSRIGLCPRYIELSDD